jgi:hypothetical protein
MQWYDYPHLDLRGNKIANKGMAALPHSDGPNPNLCEEAQGTVAGGDHG